MSFKTKQDYYGLECDALKVKSSNDGATASVAEIKAMDGSIIASTVFGNTKAPSCEYAVKEDVTWNDQTTKALGGLTKIGQEVFALASISIYTSAGSPPSLSASGEMVESDASPESPGCVYKIPALDLKKAHHAQILFSAFTVEGSGCHVESANYTISATLSKVTKDGECLAHDVVEGKIEAQVTIKAVGDVAPTVNPGDGWVITDPIALTNPDGDHASYSVTVVKYLAKK